MTTRAEPVMLTRLYSCRLSASVQSDALWLSPLIAHKNRVHCVLEAFEDVSPIFNNYEKVEKFNVRFNATLHILF